MAHSIGITNWYKVYKLGISPTKKKHGKNNINGMGLKDPAGSQDIKIFSKIYLKHKKTKLENCCKRRHPKNKKVINVVATTLYIKGL